MMQLARLLLLLPLLVAAGAEVGSETSSSTPSSLLASSPTIGANQTAPAAMMMPEAKRAPEPMWAPSPQDLTPVMMHHQQSPMPPASSPPQPQVVYPVVHSPPLQQPQPQPQQQQPFMPGNYYLSGDEQQYPSSQYAPAIGPSNEYRSEHYSSYPPFEQQQPSYPMQQQAPQLDTSLIPTAKHFVLVSFIGLLLLFSIIQNSISAAKRKDALVEVLSNRKKRDIVALASLQRMTPEVESALKEDARIRCIQRTLCYENRKLQRDLGGIFGKVLAKYLTRNVRASLRDLSPGWGRLVEDAANAGLRGEDCDVLYRDCTAEDSTGTEIIEEDEE